MKVRIQRNTPLAVNKYLYPVEEYIKEKNINGMYDDWNELEHTIKWVENILKSINENTGDILDIYYLEDNNKVIGVIFSLSGNDNILKFKEKNNIISKTDKIAQLSCFHILKDYRGIGSKWLKDEVLKDLKNEGIEEVYIKSSHNKALNLYDRIGTKIGNYISISDNELYQRYGYIYKIDLV